MAENNLKFADDPEMARAKVWWKAHGNSVIVGITLGLSTVVGFNYWQSYQQTQAENASVLFEQLQSAARLASETAEPITPEGEVDSEAEAEFNEANATIVAIARDLMTDYAATPYAAHAAFALAKSALEGGDLTRAGEALRWVLEHSDDASLLHIARLRLASVLLAQGEADAATALLTVDATAAFAARYHELLGDARFQQGDLAAAGAAYQRSLEALPPSAAERELLKLKLDGLGQQPASSN